MEKKFVENANAHTQGVMIHSAIGNTSGSNNTQTILNILNQTPTQTSGQTTTQPMPRQNSK